MPTHQFEHKPCFLYLCYCFGGPGFESVWPQLFFFSKFWYLATNNFLVFNDVKCEHLTQLSSVSVYPTITCQVSYSVSNYHTAWIRQPAGKRTGVFSKCMFWIHDILQRIIKEQVQFGLTVFQQQSDSKWTKYAPEHVAVYYCARHWQ